MTSDVEVAAAGLEQHGCVRGCVLLVGGVADEDPELVAVVLARPVALLARVTRRAQFMQRCRHRARIQVECNRHELPGTIELRLHEPVRAGADVTIGAGHAGMR